MDLGDALEQLDAIHAHLARTETYRGYRPLSLAVTGLAGLLAGAVQPWFVPAEAPAAFIHYWVVVGLACAALAGGGTLLGYLTREDALGRRRTRTVVGLFLPCLFVGLAITLAFLRQGLAADLLPGLWALVFGLGIVPQVPYLPRAAGLVAVWYLGAGTLLLGLVEGAAHPVPAGWTVGVPFGVGHLLAAAALRNGLGEGDRA